MFLLGNVWLVLLKTGFMFLRTKRKEQNSFLFFPVLAFSEQKPVLIRFHVFVRECLVSVIENRFHVFKKNMFSFQLFLF